MKSYFSFILFVLLVFWLYGISNIYSGPAVHTKTAIINARIISMEDDQVKTGYIVVIQNGLIDTLIKEPFFQRDNNTTVIDAKGAYVIPALADMHTHVYSEPDIYPFLEYGVTTILNMGSPSSILDIKKKIVTGEITGPVIYASALVDGPGSRGWLLEQPTDAYKVIDQTKAGDWDFIKVYNSISKNVYDTLMHLAKKNGIPVVGHGVREPGMKYILEAGQVMIAHAEEYIYSFFNNQLSYEKIDEAVACTKKAGAVLTPNLSAYEAMTLQWGNRRALDSMLQEKPVTAYIKRWKSLWDQLNYAGRTGSRKEHYRFLQKLVGEMQKKSVLLIAGTDAPFIPGITGGSAIYNELRTLCEAGLTPYESLQTATVNAGLFIQQYLKNQLPFGLIKKGYRADLLLLEDNPLKDIAAIRKIKCLIKGGKLLYRN